MKKLARILLVIIIVLILAGSFTIIASTDDGDLQTILLGESLEEFLIGTWHFTDTDWILVFREDGTLIDGLPGMRRTSTWQVIYGRLLVDNRDWNLRVSGDKITVDRLSGTYSYIWYSDSTEAVTEMWFFGVLIIAVLAIIACIVVLMVTLVSLRNRMRLNNNHVFGRLSAKNEVFAVSLCIGVSILLFSTGQTYVLSVFFVFTIISFIRLIKTLRSGVLVDDTGVSGKMKKVKFRYAYHEISSVSTLDEAVGTSLILISDSQSHSLKIVNAQDVRDAISHNMKNR